MGFYSGSGSVKAEQTMRNWCLASLISEGALNLFKGMSTAKVYESRRFAFIYLPLRANGLKDPRWTPNPLPLLFPLYLAQSIL